MAPTHYVCSSDKHSNSNSSLVVKSSRIKSPQIYLSPSSRMKLNDNIHRYSTSDDDSGCVMDEYSWVPSGLKPDMIHQYFSCLPGDKVPYINSVGEKWRIRQLQYQLPPQDCDARYCGNLTEIEENELKIIEETRKKECLGKGIITKLVQEQNQQPCHQCKIPIQTDEIIIMASERFNNDHIWHPQCFICVSCNELLVDLIYYKNNEDVYCGRHHAEQIKPRCAHCDELIFCEECTEAEGKVWHLKHFICVRCDCQLGGKRYIIRNDFAYCIPCYHMTVELRCNTCKKDIIADKPHITQGNIHWHADQRCFCCAFCEKNLLGRKYYFNDDQLFCGMKNCNKLQEQKKLNKYYQLQRSGSCSSVPPGPSSPSLTSISGSISPQHSDRPHSAKNIIYNNNLNVQKSPSRVRFDLRPQQVDIIQKPKPPMRNPPPPPVNTKSEPTTPAENIYETVIMPTQMSSSSSQECNKLEFVKKNRRRIKKRINHPSDIPSISGNYILSSDSSNEDEVPCSLSVLKRKQEQAISPYRSKSVECSLKQRNRLKNNHYTKGPSDNNHCCSCSSISSDSEDDSYLNDYLTESLSRIQMNQQNNQIKKSSPFMKKKDRHLGIPIMATPRTARNKKSSNSNCVVS